MSSITEFGDGTLLFCDANEEGMVMKCILDCTRQIIMFESKFIQDYISGSRHSLKCISIFRYSSGSKGCQSPYAVHGITVWS